MYQSKIDIGENVMLYLDYATNCPVSKETLEVFNNITNEYIGNPNSVHKLGQEAKQVIDVATREIANILGVKENEIIYTSGATESNNLAVKGVAKQYKNRGKHIITTYLEHNSVLASIQHLKEQGFEVDMVDILNNGLIDINHLKSLLRDDTILVSIAYVDSEIGIIQPIEEIGGILKNYPNCVFHSDIAQAVGKISVDLKDVDLASVTAHKFYGLNGIGMLIKKEHIRLEPLIHGGSSTTIYRSGTPCNALVGSIAKSLEIVNKNLDANFEHVKMLNIDLRDELCKYKEVFLNSNDNSVPFILNFGIKGVRAVTLASELEKFEVYISTKSACCSTNTISRSVYALTKDKKLATSCVRVSLSHLTTKDDVKKFMSYFKECYNKLK